MAVSPGIVICEVMWNGAPDIRVRRLLTPSTAVFSNVAPAVICATVAYCTGWYWKFGAWEIAPICCATDCATSVCRPSSEAMLLAKGAAVVKLASGALATIEGLIWPA